jgi:putative ABC transport system permease protein
VNFIVNLTLREIRSSWRRLLFFFLCIAIGVGSIVALRSLIQNLAKSVGGDARALLTADIEISTTNPFTPDQTSAIQKALNESGIVEAQNEVVTMAGMARPSDPAKEGSTSVELKGIEPPFPLVGVFTLSGGKPFDFKLLQGGGTVVAQDLLDKLSLKAGDRIRVGEAEFEIRGVFDEEPGGTGGFRLGPRVFIEKKAFDEAGLTGVNSRIRRRLLLRTSGNPTELTAALREVLKGSIVSVQSYREQEESLGEQFARTENYLSLTGLLILVLGGVGVWNVARVFVEQKRETVAILKCLGASGARVITAYLAQILILGLIGSAFGVFLAQAALWLIQYRFAADLPDKMTYSAGVSTSLQGILLGVLISLLFSSLPLLQIRNIKPNLLLRDENNAQIRRLDPTRLLFGFVSLAGLLGLAVWQAGSLKVGAFFLGGLGLTALILYTAASVLTRILRKVTLFSSFPVRQAIKSLYRPGNQTRIVLLAVGLGAFVVLAVQSTAGNLLREFDFTRSQKLPGLFIVDVQKNQVEALKNLLTEKTGEAVEPLPNVRARISLIDGAPVNSEQREVRQQQGQLGREYILTYRGALDENETVTAGRWWDLNIPATEPEVSIADNVRGLLGLDVGSLITFDVLGKRINARVTSVRKFDARNTRTAFMFVFRPGTLEAAPHTFAIPVIKKIPATERARLQRLILDQFPNVQVFDVQDIISAIQKLINNFVLAISFVGGFVVLAGILILIGSVALTKSQRIYENAVLKTLGAKRATLTAILVIEYAVLGLLAGLIATVFATALSFAVSKYLLDIDWELNYALVIAGVLATTVLVTFFGTAASFDVLFKKPLAILRAQ